MENIFLKILNMSITAGWIALAVILLRFLLRKAPKWISCLLWALVGLRLIFPFSIESALSLIPSKETIPPEIITSPAPSIHSGIESFNHVVNPVISDALAPDPAKGTAPVVTIVGVATLVWLAGIIAMLVYSAVSYLRIRKAVKTSVRTDKGVYICDVINTPFIFGIIKPKIYLPSAVSQEDAQYVLAHERAHLKRRDHLIKPFGFILLSVYWFNPLLWLSYILMCRDIELACDEKVIKDSNLECKKSYSTALLDCSIPRRMIAACPLAFGEVCVKKRIKNVLSYKKPTLWIIAVALVISIVVSVCFLTNPVSKNVDITDATKSYDVRATKLIYDNPEHSYTQKAEDLPVYRIVNGLQLQEIPLPDHNNVVGTFLGDIEFYEPLDEYSFDSLFTSQENWEKGYSASILRENNTITVYTEHNGSFYQILVQNDGSCYLVIGHTYSDHSTARWVYKAEITESPQTDIMLRPVSTGNDYLLFTYTDEQKPTKSAYLKLYPSNMQFEFCISPLSSYLPTGTYTIEGTTLILTTDSGYLSTYVFETLDSYNLEFVESKSSPLPKFKYSGSDTEATTPFKDGAIFSLSESTKSNTDDIVNYALKHPIDSILYDIDSDGKEEMLVIGNSAENPGYTYTLVALNTSDKQQNLSSYTANGKIYCKQYVTYSSCEFAFIYDNSGLSLQIKESGTLSTYDVTYLKGSVVIVKDGDEFGEYDTYAKADIDSDGTEEELLITSVYDTNWSPSIYYLTVYENGTEEYVGGLSEDKNTISAYMQRGSDPETILICRELSNGTSTERSVYMITIRNGKMALVGSTIYDSVYFDIDSDGTAELLEMSYGQTSGLFTFHISITENGRYEYSSSFQSQWYSLTFEAENGKLYVVGNTQDNPSEAHKYEIYIEDGMIILERNGEKLPYHNYLPDYMYVI